MNQEKERSDYGFSHLLAFNGNGYTINWCFCTRAAIEFNGYLAVNWY